MADMYGAIRSNEFQVKDPKAFKVWFEANVKFGEDIEFWNDYQDPNTVSFGGHGQYPCAWPNQLSPITEDDDYDLDDEQWDLDELAEEVRKHLCEGQEMRVLAAGHEKLRYVAATHLVISHTSVKFDQLYEGN